MVLILDEERGELAPGLPPRSLVLVLSGAVLMDPALENRIDTDAARLILVDSTPLGNDILDPTLAVAKASGLTLVTCRYCVRSTFIGKQLNGRRRPQAAI